MVEKTITLEQWLSEASSPDKAVFAAEWEESHIRSPDLYPLQMSKASWHRWFREWAGEFPD